MSLCVALGCASTSERKEAALYGPSESVLEVVAVLRRHVPDDTYRFPPATDFTGRNVYRASLMRLENLERVHLESLRAGHMDGVIPFAKARALERLRAYDLAAQHYRRAAEKDDELVEDALRSAETCDAIDRALEVGIDLTDPVRMSGVGALPLDWEKVIGELDERVARLGELREPGLAKHYEAVLRQEIEHADLTRARYFVSMRSALPNGHVRAISELHRMTTRHAASHLRLHHLLSLADLYAELAHEYVLAVPPRSLQFDPPHFREMVDAAVGVYQRVANEDGTPEKLQAALEDQRG